MNVKMQWNGIGLLHVVSAFWFSSLVEQDNSSVDSFFVAVVVLGRLNVMGVRVWNIFVLTLLSNMIVAEIRNHLPTVIRCDSDIKNLRFQIHVKHETLISTGKHTHTHKHNQMFSSSVGLSRFERVLKYRKQQMRSWRGAIVKTATTCWIWLSCLEPF